MEDLRRRLKLWRGRKVLMTIFPHPDDETMATGGLIMTAKSLGWRTIVGVLTAGEAGKMHINPNGKTIKEIRKQELEKAGRILGIDQIITGNFFDGKLREKQEKVGEWTGKILEEYKPGIVVTYDHSGLSGHPDHIALSLAVKKRLRNLPAPWVDEPVPLLLWATLPEDLAAKAAKIANPKIRDVLSKPSTRLSLSWQWFLKWRAARAHKSQSLGKNLPVPLGAALFLYPYEWYHEVEINREYPYRFIEYKI